MHKHYSIADAKDNLPRIVHEAESAGRVVLTRRGKPVAVMMSISESEKLNATQQAPRGLWDAVQDWRKKYPDGVDLTDAEIDSWRDRTPAHAPD